MSSRPSVILPVALALIAACAARPAGAMPLLARAEAQPCESCHTAVPALGARGLRTLLVGDRPAAVAAHPAGDGAPPGSVQAEFGAAFARGDTASVGGGRGARTSGEFRMLQLSLHSQGRLAPGVAWEARVDVDSAAGHVRLPVLAARFDGIAGGRLAARAGRFESGLPFLSGQRRATVEPFLAPVSIAAEGIELSAARPGWDAVAGLVKSERSLANPGAGTRSFPRLEDTYAWAVREQSGQFLGARVRFGRQPSTISYHAWLQHLQVEIGASLGNDRLRIEPAWLLDRFDDRPVAEVHQHHEYAILQATGRLDPAGATALVLRAEHDHVPATIASRAEDHDLEVARLVRTLSPRVRLGLEGAHAGDDVGGAHVARLEGTVAIAF